MVDTKQLVSGNLEPKWPRNVVVVAVCFVFVDVFVASCCYHLSSVVIVLGGGCVVLDVVCCSSSHYSC